MKNSLILLALYLFTTSTIAQNDQPTEKGSFSIGIHPIYPILGSYGVKAFYNLPKKWSIGILSEGGNLELPEMAVKQFFSNPDAIAVSWDYSIGMEFRYRFSKSNDIKGLYAFTTLGYEPWTVTKNEDVSERAGTNQVDKFDNWFTSLGVGYNWFPIKDKGLWVGAAYNVIFILNNTSDRTVNGDTYNLKPVVAPSFIPNLYIGWRFK